MSASTLPLLLNGERVLGEGGTEAVINPYAGVTLAHASLASDAQLDEALARAQDAAETMRRTPAHVRREWLGAMSLGLAKRRDELAQIMALEVGKPIRAARAEVDRAVLTFRIAAEEATRLGGETVPMDAVPAGAGCWGLTRREPRGVVAAIGLAHLLPRNQRLFEPRSGEGGRSTRSAACACWAAVKNANKSN